MALSPSSKAMFSCHEAERKYTVRHRDVDGKTWFETRQDCEPIVEYVKQKQGQPRRTIDSVQWDHLGEIPASVLGQFMRDGSLDDPKFIRRWLNENPAFRIYEGTV